MHKRILLIGMLVLLAMIAASLLMPKPVVERQLYGFAPDLLQAIGRCDEITSRATAHIVPIVEFQQMELESRRETTFFSCMTDAGYSENPLWLVYAERTAGLKAKEEGISLSEAMVHLKRSQMIMRESPTGQPSYWIITAKSAR
jgi:hypothetical protein